MGVIRNVTAHRRGGLKRAATNGRPGLPSGSGLASGWSHLLAVDRYQALDSLGFL